MLVSKSDDTQKTLGSNLLILEAAETVLGYFGFDRNVYSDKKTYQKRKWWWIEELRQERERDIKIETTEK
jgi:hypothetical protein